MEVINDLLGYKDLKIFQNSQMFSFSLDSVLLPNFITINSKIKNILDIGCGNCPISLILSTKTDADITGVEIQKEVYELAVKSVNLNKKQHQIKIINQDINDVYKMWESDKFDIIVSNPPFFKLNEGNRFNISSYKAIARHEISLNVENLMIISKKLLKNNGIIGIVHRPERLVDIIECMRKNNIEPKKIQFVYPRRGEIANTVLIEGKKNGKPGLKIIDPLYVHNSNGEYSDEIKKIFK